MIRHSLLAFFGAFVLTFPCDVSAQDNNANPTTGRARYEEPRFRMGLHFLPAVGWMDARDPHTLTDGTVTRFGFGFTADIMFADNYAIGTGINVFRNGGRLSHFDRVTGSPIDLANDSSEFLVLRERKLTQHWVELPVTFKFRTREIGHITYWGQFGLGLGLNLRATADDVVDYRYRNDDPVDPLWAEESVIGQVSLEDVPVENQVALMRAAMIVGLGIEYNLSGKTALLVGATFNNGLFNVANNRNFGSGRREEHIRPGLDGSLDPAILEADDAGYEVKMIDNAILMSLGLLF